MKNKLNYILSGFTLAICITSITATSAIAAPNTTLDETPETTINNDDKTDKEYNSKIILNDSEGTEVININTADTTLSEALADNGDTITDYKDSNSEPVDESQSLKNGEDISLFKSEISGDSDVIKLKAPTVKKKTDDLYVGEKEVKEKGKDGEALKTTLVTKDLASDKKINDEASGDEDGKTVEEKLTVLKAPKAKIVLVGTKERPTPTASEEEETNAAPVYDENSSSENSASTENNSSNNSSAGSESSHKDSRSSNSSKSSSKGSESNRSDVVSLVRAQLGKPYVWGATGPNSFDCSGLVYYIYHTKKGMNIPRTSTAQGMASTPVSWSDIQPGDIVWRTGHIGIYVGGGKVIHAPRAGKPVTELGVDYFKNSGFKPGRF